MKNNTNIEYRRVGDFNIPNLILPPEEANITLGKWGMLHKDYLEKYKKLLFTTLLTQGKLYQHCAEIENQARGMYDTLIEQMKESEGVTEQLKEQDQLEWIQKMKNSDGITEQLKEENQMEWICRMQNIEARSMEIVITELIYN